MVVTVHIDEKRMRDIQKSLLNIPQKSPNAISNALNRSNTNVASNLKKEVPKKYHIKAGIVGTAIKKNPASPATLKATVTASGGPIGLDKFKVSPKTINPRRKSQLKISVRKDRPIGNVNGAFNAMINGLKVMKRIGKKRLPIDRLFGPSIPQMAGNEEIANKVRNEGGRVFERRLAHEINRLLQRGG